MQCMQHNFLLTGQVYPTLMSTRQKKYLLQIDCKIFSQWRCFHVLTWYCVYRVALLCDKFWACLTWNKVAVVENAKMCRLYPTFPLFQVICPYFGLIIAFRFVCDVTIAPRIASTVANKLCWRNCPDKCHYWSYYNLRNTSLVFFKLRQIIYFQNTSFGHWFSKYRIFTDLP